MLFYAWFDSLAYLKPGMTEVWTLGMLFIVNKTGWSHGDYIKRGFDLILGNVHSGKLTWHWSKMLNISDQTENMQLMVTEIGRAQNVSKPFKICPIIFSICHRNVSKIRRTRGRLSWWWEKGKLVFVLKLASYCPWIYQSLHTLQDSSTLTHKLHFLKTLPPLRLVPNKVVQMCSIVLKRSWCY